MNNPDPRPRRAVEQRSALPAAYLAALPKWLVFLAAAGLLVAGLFAGNAVGGLVGFLCLGGVGVLLGWLAYLSWPALDTPGRAVRLVTMAVVVAVAVSFLLR